MKLAERITSDVQRVADGIRAVRTNNRNHQTSYRRTGEVIAVGS